MKIQKIFYICAIFFLSTVNSYAIGQAASMGNLQTVVPSGPFDASRNPALLTAQILTNSTGLFVSYAGHFAKENSAESGSHKEYASSTNNDIKGNIEIEDPEIKGFNVNLANLTKSKSSAIGFAFVNNGNDQYSFEERKISHFNSGTINDPAVAYEQRSNEKSKKTELNPAFIASMGFNISNKSSIGFQILAKYSGSTEKKEYYENRTLPSTYEKNEKITKEINVFSGELGFGYFFKGDGSEIGLLIKSGDFSWIKKTLSADTNRISTSENLKTDESITLNGKYTSGPSIAVGSYKRFSSFFAIALEGTFTMENSFTDRELDLDDKQSGPTSVKIKKTTRTNKQSVLFNGGMEFNLTKNLSFHLGMGYLKAAVLNSGGDDIGSHREETNIEYCMLSSGLNYILTKNIEICLTATGISYSIKGARHGKAEVEGSWEEDSYLKMESKGYYLYTGLGASVSF